MRALLFLSLISSLATVTAQTPATKDSLEVHRTDTIYFDFASAELGADAGAKVIRMAGDRPADLHLYLEGHTDAVGSNTANDRLAADRCRETMEAFVAAGWPVDMIELRHFGERQLAVSTTARESRNRRVLMHSGTPKKYLRLAGTIVDEAGSPVPGGAIALGTYLRDSVIANDEGQFSIWLPIEDSLRVDIVAKNYFVESRNYFFTKSDPAPPAERITLTEATGGAQFDIEDLYFVGNKTQFMPGAVQALRKLYLFMKYNDRARIELRGHVNHPGSPKHEGTWAYNLAGARAKTVYNYLVEQNIEPDRMSFKSYSNFEMINSFPTTAQEKSENRRVEVRILSME